MAPPPRRTNWFKVVILAMGTLVGMAVLGQLIQIFGLARTDQELPAEPAGIESPSPVTEE